MTGGGEGIAILESGCRKVSQSWPGHFNHQEGPAVEQPPGRCTPGRAHGCAKALRWEQTQVLAEQTEDPCGCRVLRRARGEESNKVSRAHGARPRGLEHRRGFGPKGSS